MLKKLIWLIIAIPSLSYGAFNSNLITLSSSTPLGNGPAAAAATLQAGFGASNYVSGDQIDYIFYEYWDMPDGTRVFSTSNTVATPHITIPTTGDAVMLGWSVGANSPTGYRVVRKLNGLLDYYADIDPYGSFPIDDNGLDLFFWTYRDGDPITLTPTRYSLVSRYNHNPYNGNVYGVYTNGSGSFTGRGDFGQQISVSSSVVASGKGIFGDAVSSPYLTATTSGTVINELSVGSIKFPDGTVQVSSPTAPGGGGSSVSALAIGTGTTSNFTTAITSPAYSLSFLGTQFDSFTSGTTNFVELDRSTVPFLGNVQISSGLTVAQISNLSSSTVRGSLRLGTQNPNDTSAPFSVVDGRASTEVRLGFFETSANTTRSEFTTANSGSGSWTTNFISLMVHGGSYASDNYLSGGTDAGLAMILGQGTTITNFAIGMYNATPVSFFNNNTIRWQINSSGHLMGFADNTYDIGASGATRPRSIYAGTSVQTASVTATTNLNIPYGTNPTVTANGAFAVDSSSNQVVAFDGANTVVLSSRFSKTLSIDNPAAGDYPLGFRTGYNITVSSLVFVSSAATSCNMTLRDCSGSDGTSCNVLASSITASTTELPVLISSTVATGRRIRPLINFITGVPGACAVDVYYTERRN